MEDTIFSPSFGNRPNQLVGRGAMIEQLLGGLASKPGSKERATLILGQRGSGKTVMLWELADRARDKGFVVASPTVVAQDLPERIIEKIQDDGERYMGSKRSRVIGGSVGALEFSVGLQFSDNVRKTKSFGYKLLKLARRLSDQGRGILILVDEVQSNSPELKQLITAYLELVGERQNAALVLAGLPSAVSSVLNDRVLTFLNRANKVALGPLPFGDVDAFFAQSFAKLGLNLDAELRREAARLAQGSPYLLQLIGHNIVQYSGDSGEVGKTAFLEALRSANRSFEEDVCQTTLMQLSDRDVDFLEAMAQDDGPSRISDIAKRMGATEDYAQKYRRRLIDGGIIEAARRGYVAFAVPLMAEHLKNGR